MAPSNHFSSPRLSNWQSAVAKVFTRPEAKQPFAEPLRRAFVDIAHPAIAAAAAAAEAKATGSSAGLLGEMERTAAAVLRLADAKILGDAEGIAAARADLQPFGDCDPRWAECVLEYVANYRLTRHGRDKVPYREWRAIGESVEDVLPAKCRIAVVGDWGTGDRRAQALMRDVAAQAPDILIHLGDIYYSCTTSEAGRFLTNIRDAFAGGRMPTVRTLCGNHDMYSGGAPFYGLLGDLGQEASYFCLRNDHWQILGGDTGYNDFDVGEEGRVATWIRDYDLRPDGSREAYSELVWHHRRLCDAGGRRTVLLTHHQPFSAAAAIDGGSALNSKLLGQFAPFTAGLALWLWGHEHNQVVYAPFAGVGRGRCVGASAVPVPRDEDPYRPDPSITGEVPRSVDERSKLTVDPGDDLWKLGYAMLEIDGPSCVESYFEFDPEGGGRRLAFKVEV